MARPSSDVQARILGAIDKQLRAGESVLTIEKVAAETRCAKGLVTYHFKTKAGLLTAAAAKLFQERDERWRAALSAATLDDAIRQSWTLITGDVATGFWRAQASLSAIRDNLTVQTVNNYAESFANLLATLVGALLDEMGLRPSITTDELGHLVSAGIQGFGMQLLCGLSAEHVEGAYAALWVAVLSLTRPRRR